MVKSDLMPLDLEKLLTDPASVLPMTGGAPIEMLIRNSEGGALMGRYGLRAVGVDTLLNVDSSRGPGVVVELVPAASDVALVTSIQSDFDGNGMIEGLEMQYTSGDVVIFSNSMVELTVHIAERTVHPLASSRLSSSCRAVIGNRSVRSARINSPVRCRVTNSRSRYRFPISPVYRIGARTSWCGL